MRKGTKMSQESRRKMRAAWIERRKLPGNRLGKRHSVETRKKISATVRLRTPRGIACHSYKDGKLAERRDLRFSRDYKRWRFDVFARDRFACRDCGDARGRNLVAHHIKAFADFPKLRFAIKNGITLCESCHARRHA